MTTPYGQARFCTASYNASTNTKDWRHLFQGLRQEYGTALYQNRNRDLHPLLGRFVQRDPLGYPDGLNAYAAYHVMYGGLDPSGEAVETVVDVASAGHSAYEMYREPSWANAGFLVWDTASVFLPFAPGSYAGKAVKAVSKGGKGTPPAPKPKPNPKPKPDPKPDPKKPDSDGSKPKDKDKDKNDEKCDKKKKCLPCIPPVGSVVWDVQRTGKAHNGIPTPHSHMLTVKQNPNNCKCFFKRRSTPVQGEMQPEWPGGKVPGGGFAP